VKVMLFANTDWYLYNFRRSLAAALHAAGHEVLCVSPPGPFGERLVAELGVRWQPAPMERRSLNPVREVALLRWLAALMSRERVDLVHSFTIKSAVYGSLAARLASRAEGVPARVNAVAGMGYVFISDDLKARVLRPVVRLLMRIALGGPGARLVLQNPDDVALFERARLVDPSRVRLIPGSGVDCSRYHERSGPRAAGGAFRVLLACRLLWDKGLAEFVEAARDLRSQGRNIEFILAGTSDPGNPAAVPESLVRAWAGEGIVQWLGHVEDMPKLLQSVDAVALPSYREGLPKSLIEAAACGLPLVTTDVPGCREVVEDGVDGLVVHVKDGPALAAAIARLQDDPALAQRLGAAARRKALDRFDERIVLRRTMDVYRELLPSGFQSF